MDLPSISSRRSVSESSVYTTTSSSTQWGPGALAGKAILAMGKAVVRSAEYLIIRRRLSAIKAVLPCPDDQRGNVEAMFNDLLELSRPTLYPEEFRTQAMQLIIAQIARKETYHLRLSISKWEIEHEELVAFLSEVIGVVLFAKRGFPDQKLVDSYNMALPSECHPWSPCVIFMSKIAQLNDRIFHGVLGARFLEMILWVSGARIQGGNSDGNLQNECQAAFQILSEPPSDDLSVLWVEQVLRLCPSEPVTLLAGMHLQLMRYGGGLGAMLDYHFFETDYLDSPMSFLHAYFHRPMSFHSKSTLSASFMRNFLRCIGIGGDIHKETVDHLSRLSYAKKVVTLTQVIRHLIAQSLVDSSIIDSSTVLFTPDNPEIISNVVLFLIDVSTSPQLVDNPILDAALLNILLFLPTRWNRASIYEDIYRRMHFSIRRRQGSRPHYRAHTSQLLKQVRSLGLSAVVEESNRTGSWVHFLQPLF
ncbi:hypothetical protein B0H19DRAFT_1065754 [Mycena capillaripes]|nr:hypothetical protein B0H19DRAFT_1065754 [Mycena capillaripes]